MINMINDEKLKKQLLFSYNLCKLYVDTEYSVSTLSDILQISLSTIKRSLHSISIRIDDYLRLLPELGTKKELEALQQSVDKIIADHKKENKKVGFKYDASSYQKQIDEIKALYTNSYGTPIKDDIRTKIIELREKGYSIRQIADSLGGISTSTVHLAILNDTKNKIKKQKDENTRKLVSLLKHIVLNIDELSNKANLSLVEIDKLINDKNYMLRNLSIDEYAVILNNYNSVFSKAKAKQKKLIFTSRAIDYIMNSRYQPIDISIHIGAPYYFVKEIIEDKNYLDENFGEGTRSKLKAKIKENGLMRMKAIRGENKIENKWHILYLKDDIYSLDSITFRILNLTSEYLQTEANIDYLSKKYGYSYQTIISTISSSNLENILKPEYYKRLRELLGFEKQFNTESVVSNIKLLDKVITMLESNGYNIDETVEKTHMPYFMLKRLLNQNKIIALYGNDIYEKISNMFRGIYGDREINNNKRK